MVVRTTERQLKRNQNVVMCCNWFLQNVLIKHWWANSTRHIRSASGRGKTQKIKDTHTLLFPSYTKAIFCHFPGHKWYESSKGQRKGERRMRNCDYSWEWKGGRRKGEGWCYYCGGGSRTIPPLFFCESTASVLYSPTASVLQSTFPQGEIKPRREMEWRGEGKGDIWRKRRLFFSRGESVQVYSPMFLEGIHVCGNKNKLCSTTCGRVLQYTVKPNRVA